MRVALTTSGTRGDAQPLILLARELLTRGHEPVLGLPPNVADLGRGAGIPTHDLGPNTQVLMESDQGQAWLAAGNTRAFMRELSEMSARAMDLTRAGQLAAGEGADVFVAGVLMQDLALPHAEALGVPMLALHSFPFEPNRAFPNPFVTSRALPGVLNHASGKLFENMWWKGFRDEINGFRKVVGLPPTKVATHRQFTDRAVTAIQAYDAALVPGLEQEYGARRPLVGFLAPDAGLRESLGEVGLPAGFGAWLDDGDAPVFFGFGSMPVRDPAAAVAMITDVSRRLGVRAVVNAGWGGLAALDPGDPNVTVIGAVDHDTVLGRCRAAVHHGGAGTTYASLAAGLPTVICSVFADQPFWGARVKDAGVGATFGFADLDVDRLEGALRIALEPATTARASALGETLRGRPSAVARAADLIEAAAGR